MDNLLRSLKINALLYGMLARLYQEICPDPLLKQIGIALEEISRSTQEETGETIDRIVYTIQHENAETIEQDYIRLFIGTQRVLAPPWESVYRSEWRLVMQKSAYEVHAAYLEAGFGQKGSQKEPDDHIGLELEFLSRLSLRAAESLEQHRTEEATRDMMLRQRFLEEHLLAWISPFVDDVQKYAETSFWKYVARLTLQVARTDAALLKRVSVRS